MSGRRDRLEAAKRLIALGYKVLPFYIIEGSKVPPSKVIWRVPCAEHPLSRNSQHDVAELKACRACKGGVAAATDNVAYFEAVWKRVHKNALVGVIPPVGVIAIDDDTHVFDDQWSSLEQVRSQSGKSHGWFRLAPGQDGLRSENGIDFTGDEGYVDIRVGGDSRYFIGIPAGEGPYEGVHGWEPDPGTMRELEANVYERLLEAPRRASEGNGGHAGYGSGSPGVEGARAGYAADKGVAAVEAMESLLENAGWAHDQGESWTRPGKDSGTSATLAERDGVWFLFVFTAAPEAEPLKPEHWYTASMLRCVLEQGGDWNETMIDLLDEAVEEEFGVVIPASKCPTCSLIGPCGALHADPPSGPPATGSGELGETCGSNGGRTKAGRKCPGRGGLDDDGRCKWHGVADERPAGSIFDPEGGVLMQVFARSLMDRVTLAVDEHDPKQFWTYEQGVWTLGNRPLQVEVATMLGDAYSATTASTVEQLIARQRDVAFLNPDPVGEVLNLPNGLLRWGAPGGPVLGQHDPAVKSTVRIPVEWPSDGREPVGGAAVRKFIAEVFPADAQDYAYELIGYLMLSGNPLQCGVLLRGDGGNGKGTFLRMITELVGGGNASNVTLEDLSTNRFRVATLYGRLINIAGDLDPKRLDSTAMFKSVTGQDDVAAERKYGGAFMFRPWAVPVYSANREFSAGDTSEGYYRRWQVIPFERSFIGQADTNLDAKLTGEGELQWLLWRAVQGLRDLMERGKFSEPESLVKAKASFVMASDAVRDWLDEHCEVTGSSEDWITRSEVALAYEVSLSMDSSGKGRVSNREFYARLRMVKGIDEHKREGARGFLGLRLKAGVREQMR